STTSFILLILVSAAASCENQEVLGSSTTEIPQLLRPAVTEVFFLESQIKTIPKASLPNLKEIGLYGNKITELPPNLFPHKDKLNKLLLDNNLLTDLKLKNNQLTSLPPVLFGEMPKLTELSLQQNNLSSLPTGIFSPLKKWLSTLKLAHNNLQTLPGDVFEPLTKLKKLDLSNNPWSCDCNLVDFYSWMKANADKLTNKVVCQHPEHLNGMEVISLVEDQLICPTFPPTTTILTTTTTPITTTTGEMNKHTITHEFCDKQEQNKVQAEWILNEQKCQIKKSKFNSKTLSDDV
uniref:LRRCT domain-containing protein n=1 Tax=Acanthochromis polyacanthus TaxID=80966 RepID=A0A3Q1F298_9TELE